MPFESLRRRHLQRLERRIRLLDDRSRGISRARLAVVVTGSVVVFLVFRSYDPEAGVAVLGLFLVAFLFLIRVHDRVEESLKQTRYLLRIKSLHERRRALDWNALPETFGESDVRVFPLAADLNVVGPRSLHHLLDTCASQGGSNRLKEWLVDPLPDHARTLARQRLVQQLVPLRIFRDHLTRLTMLDGSDADRQWDDQKLRRWLAREEVVPLLKPWLIGLSLFAALNVALILLHVVGTLPALWPMTVLVYFAVYFMRYRAVDDLFDEAHDLEFMLQRFTPALLYVERFQFRRRSEAAGATDSMRISRPSTELRWIRRIASASAVTRSEFLWLLLNLIMPWEMLFAYLMHRAKESVREHLPAWLDTWYVLEAASSLASYADHHPDRVFPVIEPVDVASTPVFEGRDLGHPLLQEDVKVRNDFIVDRLGEVILVTGSNMSGKSTFLRTIGVNLQLAYAGGPVDASALRTTCFRVFTSINVVDSVQEGLSHFYAEVQRLKSLLDALEDEGGPPLFNLIDEIFRGTNNRERLIGSRAFIRALAGRRAISLISTHDLELTRLEGEIPLVRNFHFREDVSGERMTFDYALRGGPSPTTNALKIMARAGLPVDPDESRVNVD